MGIELETESYDDDEDLDGGCNDVGLSGLSPRNNPRLEPLFESVQRSLDEILQLEIHLINTCTDLDPITWVHLYGEKFRKIMDENSSDSESVIKRKLYVEK